MLVRDPVRHRFLYQDALYQGADLIGLGPASFSYMSGVHQQNATSLKAYMDAMDGNGLPLGRTYRLSGDEQLVREFILQLKMYLIKFQKNYC